MPEPMFLLRVWGRDKNLIAARYSPDKKEENGKGAFCYWFQTHADREAFIICWPNDWRLVKDCKDPSEDEDEKETINTRTETIAHVVLRFPDGHLVELAHTFGYGYSVYGAEFMWRDGNYHCDCNKRRLVWRQNGLSEQTINALENPCGETIILVSLSVTKKKV